MRLVVMIAVLAVGLGGCARETSETVETDTAATAVDTVAAGDTAASASAPAANPCAAVTAEEVTALAGMQMTAHPGDTENDCSFRTADDHVKLIVKSVDAAGYDAMAAAKGAERVSGLGDRAVWVPWANSLLAVKGEKMLDVTYDESPEVTQRATPQQQKERAIALAEKILPKI